MSDEIPVKTILVLSANPRGTQSVRLAQEIREIKEGLQLAKKRDSFQIESAEAVRDRDIHRSILKHEPQIIHFSGHGAGEEGLIFEDSTGQPKLVDAEALAGLFEYFADDIEIECVLLNACYSEIQAKAIAQHIDYVIGMSKQIGDKAAIEFAVGFYDALGAGKGVESAYKLGCKVIRMAGIKEHLTPQLLKKEDWHGASINITPVPTSPPQDARKASVVSPSPTPPTPLVSKQEEPENIAKYRQQVEEFASDGVIDDDIESHILNNLQKKLVLTDQQAGAVREEVLEPYKIYKEQFIKKVEAQGYPLGEKAEAELKKLQNYYQIKDEYVNLLKQEREQQEAENLRQKQEAEAVEKLLQKQQEEAQRLQRQREQEETERLRQQQETEKLQRKREQEAAEQLQKQREAEAAEQLQKQQDAQRLQQQREQQEAERLQRQKQKTDDLPSEKGVDYTKLRDLLAAGKWKEADQETLAVMLKATGREKEGYLDSKSIENFPCTDLRTIDQLWIQYSKELFGFSVQKRIYESVGKDYEKFGDRVGWRKGMFFNKEWLNYNDFTFSLNAPQGHLPFLIGSKQKIRGVLWDQCGISGEGSVGRMGGLLG